MMLKIQVLLKVRVLKIWTNNASYNVRESLVFVPFVELENAVRKDLQETDAEKLMV